MVFMATVGFCPAAMTALAQEQTSPEELNRRYNDTLNQLRAAQDRKNELATENEKLTARVTDLEKQLDEARRQAATFSEQTFRLRVHYAAWLSFVRRYPLLLEKWKLFVEGDPLAAPSSLPEMLDPTSPLSVP
jgi:DNA repair ATPase RecN